MDCLNMGPYQRLYQFENIAEDVFLVGYIVNHNGKMVELMFYFKDDDCSLPYPVTTRTLTSRSERECAALFSDEVAIQQKYLNHELDKSLETEVPIWKMKKIVREVNSLLDKRDANITEDLLLKLDKLGSKVELKEEVSTSTITDNVAIVISNPALDRPRGIRIAAEKNDTFREDSFSYISGSNYSQYLNSNVSSTVVLLPPSAIDSPSRISFVVFRDNRVFRDLAGDVVVNSRIVSVNIYNYTNFDEGEAERFSKRYIVLLELPR
ncbi:uncharacterized protein LOC131843993 [Achroia grisella]|uniref:uncharacterized protein LOC131843993 n=1 Tax=Achroia grisella TaxID=688607 RepID=UPI0027D1EFB2|nr:uncharacterized protein LOC131843993 [Achroia grisella]